jgi:hypothetical protein
VEGVNKLAVVCKPLWIAGGSWYGTRMIAPCTSFGILYGTTMICARDIY